MYTYEFDIHKNKLVSDCKFYPTEVTDNDAPWLYARNNKYPEECIDYEKVGKWMLFLSKDRVNAIWDKIKMAVKNGELWHSKVSTSNSEKTHAIMIYTKDYEDLNDVIHVLNYLESSGIKSRNVIIKYKTDQQTYAGIYRGGKQKPWIYTSDTICRPTITNTQRSSPLSWRNRNTQSTNQSEPSASSNSLSWRNRNSQSTNQSPSSASSSYLSWRNRDNHATNQSSLASTLPKSNNP